MNTATRKTSGAAVIHAKVMGICRNPRYSDIELKQEQSGAGH